MDKKELTQRYRAFLRDFKLGAGRVVVGAGGALCVLGLREETSDIDVDVPLEVFNWLLKLGLPTHEFVIPGQKPVQVIEATDVVDVHVRTNKDPVVLTDGVCHYTPEVLLAFKQKLNREKDQEDIRKLKKYVGV